MRLTCILLVLASSTVILSNPLTFARRNVSSYKNAGYCLSWAAEQMPFFTVTFAFAQQAVVVKGLFIGHDSSDPSAVSEAIYKDTINHPIAAASILTHRAKIANFCPCSQTAVESLYPFFIFHATWVDGFIRSREEVTYLPLEHGGYDELEMVVHERYDPTRNGLFARMLREMVPSAKDVAGGLTRWKFFIVAISTNLPGGINNDNNTQVALFRHVELYADAVALAERAEQLAKTIAKTAVRGFKRHFTSMACEDDVGDKRWWNGILKNLRSFHCDI